MAPVSAGHIRIFRGVQNTTSVAGGGTIVTKGVPCKYAKHVRAVVTSGVTEAAAIASLAFNVGMGDAPVYQNPSSLGYTQNSAVGVSPRAGDGPSAILSATAPNAHIYHDRAQAVITASATAIAGPINVDIEVYYENEADFARAGQALAVEV
jgi:hypothetical protein